MVNGHKILGKPPELMGTLLVVNRYINDECCGEPSQHNYYGEPLRQGKPPGRYVMNHAMCDEPFTEYFAMIHRIMP